MNGIGAKMTDVANSTNQIQFCLFASGGKISAPATRSLFTFPMNSTLNFPPLTSTHDATRKANLPWAVRLVYLFILIHSQTCEIDKRVHSIECGLHTKWGRRETLRFLKTRDSKVWYNYLKFWEWQVSWKKNYLFFNSLETTEISRIF